LRSCAKVSCSRSLLLVPLVAGAGWADPAVADSAGPVRANGPVLPTALSRAFAGADTRGAPRSLGASDSSAQAGVRQPPPRPVAVPRNSIHGHARGLPGSRIETGRARMGPPRLGRPTRGPSRLENLGDERRAAQRPLVLLVDLSALYVGVGSSGGVRCRLLRCFGGRTACPCPATARALTGARPASGARARMGARSRTRR
jgi:hypothetical protein